MKEVVIFGAGGHGLVVQNILSSNPNIQVSAFSGLNFTNDTFSGIQVLNFEQAIVKYDIGIVGIGENFNRSKVVEEILKIKPHFNFINAIHPTSIIAKNVKLGVGLVISAGTIINPNTVIEDHVILNTGSIIEHDCLIKKFGNISPGVVIGGNCQVGVGSLVGIGSSMIHGKKIGDYSICGAHSLLYHDISDCEMHFGVPAKFKREVIWGDKFL